MTLKSFKNKELTVLSAYADWSLRAHTSSPTRGGQSTFPSRRNSRKGVCDSENIFAQRLFNLSGNVVVKS